MNVKTSLLILLATGLDVVDMAAYIAMDNAVSQHGAQERRQERLSRHDYPGFYEYEIAVRRAALFPPFSLFARVLFAGEDEDALYHISESFAAGLREAVKDALVSAGADPRELLFLFASPAPLKRKQGQYRYQVLLKLARTKHTAAALAAIYAYYDERRPNEASGVEINPQDMF